MLSLLAFAVIQTPADIPILSGLGISGVTQGGRVPAPIDTVQAMIVDGTWKEPHAGDTVVGARASRPQTWTEIKANKDGTFEGGPTQGGYIYATYDSDVEKPMLLVAQGDSMVYINGDLRGGDPYGYGWLELPFLMKKGHNTFLFSCGRGMLKAKLQEPKATAFFNTGDMTLPDVLSGDSSVVYGAVPVVNVSGRRRILTINASAESSSGRVRQFATQVALEPFSVRKGVIAFAPDSRGEGEVKVRLSLSDATDSPTSLVDRTEVTTSVRKPTDHYKRTFVSAIDGSVQYYAVAPSLKPDKSNALILTVHGASVEATNQANAYKSKDWCTIVAPTNRRPYGFDWEDWGRMDAMEVWDIAKQEFPHDPLRQILTGHSMGGHGTWQIGLTYPNEFAAIGPSAGWISFWSYAGGWEPKDPNPVEQMLRRSMNQSDTLLMLRNALNEDVYILHGDKDDNVPVEQAREMKKHLEDVGCTFTSEPSANPTEHQYVYHEQPGAGHWWGDQCVDWPPMFDLFAAARLRQGPAEFEFATLNPAASSNMRGFSIEQQIDPLLPSKLMVRKTANGWSIATQNVARFVVSGPVYSAKEILVNGQQIVHDGSRGIHPASMRTLTLAYDPAGQPAGFWFTAAKAGEKSSTRSGPFKLAFQNDFAFVVGTHGTPQENAWALNKARYDAEQWYYRGNGSVDILTDDEVAGSRTSGAHAAGSDQGRSRAGSETRGPSDRNLILYGHADMNSAWKLLKASPLQVRRGALTLGGHKLGGDDAAVVFLYPEGSGASSAGQSGSKLPHSKGRLIGVVAGTGMKGLRYCDRIPYFTSGIAYPDWTIFRASALTEGSKRVIGAGFFGNDWKFDPKQSAFLEP